MDVTAAILAGGLGTRLRPVVADRPKPLASVGGRPFIMRLLDQLTRASIREVVLLVGYRAEQMRESLGTTYESMRLIYAEEPHPLGTAGALYQALPLFSNRTILLLNGDSYCDVDLHEFYQWHRRHAGEATLVAARVPDIAQFGQVRRDERGRVLSFQEKGQAGGPGWINAGIYLIARRLLANLPATCPLSLERDVLPGWVARRLLWGMECRGRFLDIGTPESYAEAEEFFRPPQTAERSLMRC
jgi:NDP-sugar pyrophosphorylase family protein